MKKLSVEEYMQTLLRIGFERQDVLKRCYDHSFVANYTNLDDALAELEAAAKACGIHSENIVHLYNLDNEIAHAQGSTADRT